MLNEFVVWGKKKVADLINNGFEAAFTLSDDSSNPSARLDIDTESTVARITSWNSGDVDLEVIDLESEKTTYGKQLSLSAPFDFDREFHEFFSALGINF